MACTAYEITTLRGVMSHGEQRRVYHSTDLCQNCTASFLSYLGKLLSFSMLHFLLTAK